jgi:uncharacterized membrane protein
MSRLKVPKIYRVVFAIIALLPILELACYPFMPSVVAIHWSFGSSPDGYGSKVMGLMVGFASMFSVLLVSLIGIAAAQMEDQRAGKFFGWFSLFVALFLLYSRCLFMSWDVGLRLNYNVMGNGGLILFVTGTMALFVKYWLPLKFKIRRSSKEPPL